MNTSTLVTRIHYGQQPPPGQPVIVFAGPTSPDPTKTRHWHDKGISFLSRTLTQPVTVALPTSYDGQSHENEGQAQFNWEQDHVLQPNNLVLVYLPRIGPGTYFELGQLTMLVTTGHLSASQIALCIPDTAVGMDIPRYAAQRYGLTIFEYIDTALTWLLRSNQLIQA